MAYSLNKAQIIGNLTRDPEVRQTPNGAAVASFGVATNFSWTDSNGQKQEKVEFHNIVAWRKLAEICQQYLRKGSKVYIEGRLQTRDWQGEDGIKRYRTEIIADSMIMLDRKGGEGNAGLRELPQENMNSAPMTNNPQSRPQPKAQTPTEESTQPNSSPKAEEEITMDDLPF